MSAIGTGVTVGGRGRSADPGGLLGRLRRERDRQVRHRSRRLGGRACRRIPSNLTSVRFDRFNPRAPGRSVVNMDGTYVDHAYAEHLTDADLDFLAAASGTGERPGGAAARLRREPAGISRLVGHPAVFEAVFGRAAVRAGRPALVSPFLAFAVAVHRAAAELASMTHVPERTGPRQRVPVLDAPLLAGFLESPERRLFLAELLASFTRTAEGRYQVRTPHGPRWLRFSEAHPARFAGLLDAVSEGERPGVYRRLGDIALFLAGVFPDHTFGPAFGPVQVERLLREAHVVRREEKDRLAATPGLELMEYLGTRWYRRACELATVRTKRLAVVAEVAERFRAARRVLNHVADRYLFPAGETGFASPGR